MTLANGPAAEMIMSRKGVIFECLKLVTPDESWFSLMYFGSPPKAETMAAWPNSWIQVSMW
jgi:hypothetical protein